MNLLFITVLFSLNYCVYSTEVLRPRGVSLTKASLYAPGKTFRCIDGSGTIPYTYINDDYCDCRDGSDEPGTAACPNGIFHCNNMGHQAIDLRTSRVNDGVCDCCDGTDEWAGGVQCSDQCLELGRAAREEAIRKEEELLKGYELKLGMIEQGKNIRNEKENRIVQLKNDLEKAEAEKHELEQLKLSAEEPESEALEQYREAEEAKKAQEKTLKEAANQSEAREVFESLDTDGDSTITTEELQADITYDTNRDGTVTTEEAEFYLQKSDSVDFDTFYSQSWRLMRPAYKFAQKQKGGEAVPPPEPLFRPPPPPEMTPPPPTEEDAEPAVDTMDDSAVDSQDDSVEDDLDESDEPEEDSPDYLEDTEAEEEASDPPQEVVYDEETQLLVDAANAARSSFEEADRRVKDLNRQLIAEEEKLNKDFGNEDQFRALDGNCYDFSDREYTYTLCPFEKATQAPKSGGGETRLGSWGEWVKEEGSPLYAAMKYTNGQGCWNGPNRSTKVVLICGVENKLLSAIEPSKCEYEFSFSSPAACVKAEEQILHVSEEEENEEEDSSHDEL